MGQVPKNNYKAELDQFQTFRELNYLMRYVLAGFEMPLRLQEFVIGMFTITKPGKDYFLSDSNIASDLNYSSKNYVCDTRKKYTEYHNGQFESGRKHPQIINIIPHFYNPQTKEKIPTKYNFSIEFVDLIIDLIEKVRVHRFYDSNWIKAIKEVCKENISLIEIHGDFNAKKRVKERNKIKEFGTLLLHRHTHDEKIFRFLTGEGFEPGEVKEFMQVDSLMHTEILDQEHLEFKNSGELLAEKMELDQAFDYADSYIQQKTEVTPVVIPRHWRMKNVWNYQKRRRSNEADKSDGQHRNSASKEATPALSTHNGLNGSSKGKQSQTTLDNERLLFLSKCKNKS